jgi:SAM-dependent methyltransferase
MKKDRLKMAVEGAFKNYSFHRAGRCNICGKFTLFVCIDVMSARNNMFCIFCRSSSRNRHVAEMLKEKIAGGISSIRQIPHMGKKIRILNTSIGDSLCRFLNDYEHFVCSDLLPDVPAGTEIRPRVFCQDLEHLTFPDSSCDIIITQDVLEHVKNHKKAFREIHRVLSAGGHHIFTVPFVFDQPTIVRVDPESGVNLLPPEYHRDSLRGIILAYRTFGTDMFSLLEELGFDTFVYLSTFRDQTSGIFDSYVFVSKKEV